MLLMATDSLVHHHRHVRLLADVSSSQSLQMCSWCRSWVVCGLCCIDMGLGDSERTVRQLVLVLAQLSVH